MRKYVFSVLTYVFTFGLCAFLIWFSLKDMHADDWTKIRFALSKAHYVLLIPIVAMGLISHWSRAERWKCLMEPLELYPRSSNTFLTVMVGYLANMGLPRLGEIIKCTLLARYEKLPADKLIGTIIAERAFDMLCLGIIFVLTILVQTDLALDFLQQLWHRMHAVPLQHAVPWLFGISAFGLLLFIMLRKRIAQWKLIRRLRQLFRNIVLGILSFRTMKSRKKFVFHTILIWTMYFSMIVLGFQSIEATSSLGYKTGLSVLSFGSIGMIATPGGLGAYTLLVNEIVSLYGVDAAISLAISWIVWLVPTLIILIGGSISLLLLPALNAMTHAKQTGNHTT